MKEQEFTSQYDINEMEARVRELRAQAKKKKVEAHGAFDTQLRMAEAQLELMKAKFKNAREKSEAITSEIKSGVEDAWRELKTSVERASQYIN